MSAAETLYTLALRAARPLLPLAARGEGKLARGIRGRAGVLERLETWARTHREPARPLVWFHAPSVGEGLQARAVVQAFRARSPDAQVAYTFFSPSAESFARTVQADVADYLPLDLPGDVRRALDALRPDVIAFSKTDVWPVLTREAKARGVRLAMLSGTLPASSSRLGGPARALLAPAYARLDVAAAISPDDADRFGALGVPADRRRVMGDARFDQVWARARGVDRASSLLSLFDGFDGVTLVAGSTWPADEERLVPALASLIEAGHRLRAILVPHEPTLAHVEALEARLRGAGITDAFRLSQVAVGALAGTAVVVDRVGVLGDLYALADVAYVGGGWGTAGLHSVLEPAAFGAPVLFGPRHANAREAAELIARGGAFELSPDQSAAARILPLIEDAARRRAAGDAARAYVEANMGAAERGAEIIESLLARR
ncbi:3-deoxy-D-manno-octulosonic acid transferase [Longimicrobium sp.]|uniref:3-deoxy-D-manno-octulosonic acid transferase n=1 Tax=Longimicrobium sp. TaxID=2029185 RepID=UPI002E34EBC6|nr:glycosyltransferase N-terminal domain-containing protein [Longimicrobium sp.]HEX6039883.1 glycosyltransferase N-terminal domain-containing protein [Longimicrobium sp.]